jgi:hypothetical protein
VSILRLNKHVVELLTPWEKDLEILEDWLNNPEPEDGCQETFMQIGVGCQHEEKMEKYGMEPVQTELIEDNLSEEIFEQ